MNLALPAAKVRSLCAERGVSISAMEPLPDGGTHLVCMTDDGADEIRLTLGDHLIAGRVNRFRFYRG